MCNTLSLTPYPMHFTQYPSPLTPYPSSHADSVATCTPQAPHSFGISGFHEGFNNGTYVQSGPRVNGRPAYAKEGGADRWCCYDPSRDNWKMQRTEYKGSAAGLAHTLDGREPWVAGGVAWKERVDQYGNQYVQRSPVVVSGVQMTEVLGPGMRSGGGWGRGKAESSRDARVLDGPG